MRIRIRTLKHLAFRWWVFFGFNLLAPSTFWRKVFALFVVLGGGTVVFTFWAFRLTEQQEAGVHHRSEQRAALHQAALALTQGLDLGIALQQVVDQARTSRRGTAGARVSYEICTSIRVLAALAK